MVGMRRRALVVSLCLLAAPALAQAGGGPFDAAGYRAMAFRAPVDRDPAPARQMPLARARALDPVHGALFLDVLPAEGAKRDPATGQWTLAQPHETIEGAEWFPETGRSPPEPVLWAALRARVSAFRQGHRRAPVVVFCRADCWMSWNVARRLALSGIGEVYWLAEGIEGWHEMDGTLVAARPVPVPDLP